MLDGLRCPWSNSTRSTTEGWWFTCAAIYTVTYRCQEITAEKGGTEPTRLMNRRQFLRALALASAAVPSACTVTTPPAAESAPAASANSLALAAKRYDGRSGAAVFTGCIPLKPGQIFESDLTPITLWESNTELGLTVSALWPQHPDGSVKVIQCHTTLTLASGVTKALTLRFDRTRAVAGPAAATINEAWMKQPRLLACTDATHLCASRVAGLPLVPIPNPALPARWNTWLTTEFDLPGLNPNWGAIKARIMADDPNSIGGAANYNVGHLMYCRYLTSGNLDHLYEAHHVMQFAPGSPIPMRWNTLGGSGGEYPAGHIMHTAPPGHDADRTIVYYGEAYGGHAKDSPFQTVFENWAIAGDPGGSSGMVGDSEHYSGFRADYFTCYCLSGWPQALGTLLGTCLGKFPRSPAGAFPGALQPWSQILANESLWHGVYFLNYGGRAQWRHMRNPDLYYLLLSRPWRSTAGITTTPSRWSSPRRAPTSRTW
jgi:hypothetical protein